MDIMKIALLPLTIAMFGISLAAIYDVSRQTYTTNGSKGLWILFIVLFNFLGAFIYYFYGRREEVY